MSEFWNKDNERVFIDAYIDLQGTHLVRDYMKEKYPELKEVLTTKLVKSKLVSLMRKGMRKLVIANKIDRDGPRMHQITFPLGQKVIEGRGNREIKIKLLEMYREDEPAFWS